MQCLNIVNSTVFKYLLPVVLGVLASSAHAKMYKWVDAQGKVQYSDTLPPNAAGQGNAEISKGGQTVKKTESELEKRARLAREAEAAEQKKIQDEQARKDRALLSTYTTVQEIDLARDRALEHHKLAIKSAQSMVKPLEQGLREETKKINAAKAAGKPVHAALKQQYDAKLSESISNLSVIKKNEEAMIAVRARYEADKLRFMELTGKKADAPVVSGQQPAVVPGKGSGASAAVQVTPVAPVAQPAGAGGLVKKPGISPAATPAPAAPAAVKKPANKP